MIEQLKSIIKDNDCVICYFINKLPFGSKEVFGKSKIEENILL